MANRNWASGGKLYSMHAKPVFIQCSFIVDRTNGNGLGNRSLKGPAVANVFMNTTQTPGSSNGVLNPNPAAGLIYIQLADNYNQYLAGFSGFVSQVTGSNLTSTTSGNAYVIVSLGTTTAAQWAAAGVPAGQTAAVGMAFIAIATGSIGGSGAVKASGVSGIVSMEVIGDANQSIAPVNTPGLGASFVLQCLAPTVSAGAYVSPLIPTAPADNAVVSLSFILSDSSVPMGLNSGT